jgi:hypothetical protein
LPPASAINQWWILPGLFKKEIKTTGFAKKHLCQAVQSVVKIKHLRFVQSTFVFIRAIRG